MQILVKIKCCDKSLSQKEASQEARALLSLLLAEHGLPTSPLLKDENGRPYVARAANESAPRFDLNLSHAGRVVAVAVAVAEHDAETPRVGIDVEVPHERIDKKRLAARFFSPAENERLARADDAETEFLRIWTRKEAYLKFIGTGLAGGLRETDTENAHALGVVFSEHAVEGDANAVLTVCTAQAR